MKIFLKPLVLSVLGTGLWILLRTWGLDEYLQGDEGAIASGLVAFLAVAYALFAAFLFATVWSQWVAVEEAVRVKDRQKFDLHKDKRIPRTAKALLLLFSFFLVGAFYLLSFRHLATGGFSIFAVIMVIITYWQVILDLDDPFTGIWNVEVPKEWREQK